MLTALLGAIHGGQPRGQVCPSSVHGGR